MYIDDFLISCNEDQELSTSEIRVIKDLIERNNITQIISSFSIQTALCLLSFYETLEDYQKCGIIKKRIEIHNKIRNTEFKTHLEHNDR